MADLVHPFTTDAARGLGGPDWLMKRRAAAAEAFAASDPPSASAEEWRYSPISDLDLGAYSLVPKILDQFVAAPGRCGDHDDADLDRAFAAGTVAVLVEIDNDGLVAVSRRDEMSASDVRVGSLTAAADGAELLGSVGDAAGDCFTVLNEAFSGCPIVVDVPDGATVDGVIAVRHHACGAGTASFPRLVVRLGRGAQATVLDVQHSAGRALIVPVVELDVGQAARLGYLNLQQHDHQAWQIAAHTARVERDASLVAASVALGGGYARTRTDIRLVGQGASGDLLSAYLGSGEQILDFRTYQDHAAPDTTSNLLFKGAVGDSARSVYTGLIRVRPEARGTNAFQTNRNLKLSDNAWAESVPNLEIENNDVRCSHASAVGPVDPDQVFYLESRGVPTAVAERLIVAGFFDEVIDELPVRSVEPEVRRALTMKLNQMLSLAPGRRERSSHSPISEDDYGNP